MAGEISRLVGAGGCGGGVVNIMFTYMIQRKLCSYTGISQHPVGSPISQIQRCIRQIAHYAAFCNRYACAHFCYKLLHCGIWDWCIVVFVQQIFVGFSIQIFHVRRRYYGHFLQHHAVGNKHTVYVDDANEITFTRGDFPGSSGRSCRDC